MAARFEEVTISESYQLGRVEQIDRTKIKTDYVSYRPQSSFAPNATTPFLIHVPREDVFA